MHGVKVVAIGVGVVGVLFGARTLEKLLHGVRPLDVMTLAPLLRY